MPQRPLEYPPVASTCQGQASEKCPEVEHHKLASQSKLSEHVSDSASRDDLQRGMPIGTCMFKSAAIRIGASSMQTCLLLLQLPYKELQNQPAMLESSGAT